MALTGHADDCPACAHEQLPDEDKAVLEPAAFTQHARKPKPSRPARLPAHLQYIAAAVTALLFLVTLAVSWRWMGLLALAGLGVTAALSVKRGEQQTAIDSVWRSRVMAWRAEQTQAWRTAYLQGKTWWCPTCGSLSCNNQHSVTATKTVRTGIFTHTSLSETDPV